MSQPLDAEKTKSRSLGPALAEARGAVLLLHGFTGTPWEVLPLAEGLAALGYHVRVPRLPGHGTVPEDMRFAGRAEWEQAAQDELDALAEAKRVVVAGLSMGGLLAVRLAARNRERVAGLVLMAPVVTLRGIEARAMRALRHTHPRVLDERWVSKSSVDLSDDDERLGAPLLPRYPLGRLFDLFTLQDAAWDDWPRTRTPALVLAAENDHVVDLDGVVRFAAARPGVRLVRLQRGFHQLCRDKDRALVVAEAGMFVDGVTQDASAGLRSAVR